MRFSRARWVAIAVAAALLTSGCAARWAFRRGQIEAKKGNWDVAVARFTRALQKDPDNIGYKLALENARTQASRQHYAEGRKHMAAEELERAAEELEIAVKYDPSNKSAIDDLELVRDRIDQREEEKRRLADFEAMKTRAQAVRVPIPVLSPRSQTPITLRFTDASLEKVFETLGKVAGVNVLFDEGFRDKRVNVNVAGVTFQEALDQLTLVNRLFYKVLDQNTVIIVPESAAKRRQYDELMLRTFYLQNAEPKEVEAIIKNIVAIQKVVSNATLGAITILGTLDQLALAERIIEANDKARGEVMVQVEILEVNRTSLKRYGIELSQYEASSTLSPTGAQNEVAEGFLSVRAHILSSLNLADYIVNIPATLFARFLQTDSTVKILAAPKLRAAEGKPTEMRIGTEVPIPVTTFTATQAGTSTFAPATTFNYRNVGVNLRLTPRVTAGGDITLEIVAEFSLLGDDRNVGTGQNPIIVPTFLTRRVEGIHRLKDGETSLIGGLLQSRDATSLRGALGLQNVPIVGKVFTSTNPKTKEDLEILISLTPHLVRGPKLTEADLRSLFYGTLEVPKVPGARPPLFGPLEEPSPAPSPSPSPSPPTGPGVVPPTGPGLLPLPAPIPSPVPTPTPTPAAPATPVPPPPGAPEAPVAEPRPPGTAPEAAPGTGATTALLSPPEVNLKVGETSSVALVTMGARDLSAVEVVLLYDPAVLEAVDVASGSLLTLDGATVRVDKGLEPGRVRATFSRPSGVTGSGVVASVSIRALRPGTATLTVGTLNLSTGTGVERPSPAAARITVLP